MLLRNPRALLVCIGAAFILLFVVSLRYFLRDQPLTALGSGILPDGAEQVALEADDVQVVGRDAGQVRWRMTARTVTLSRDRRIITISGIRRGSLYGAGSRPAVALTADQASYETPFGMLGLGSAGVLRVSGDVQAHLLSAVRADLRADLLTWDSQTNALACPGAMTAILPKLLVTAGNAAYDSSPGAPAHGSLHLGGGIHARFDSPRGVAILDCPGLTWNADTQAAQTTGSVTARIPGGLGTASAADVEVNTHTGDLTGHGFRGTLLLSHLVQ